MIKIKIAIAGVTPLICNRFSDEQAIKASGGTSSSSSAGDYGTPLEIAESKLYKDLDQKPMIPQPNLLRCIAEGGQFHKMGKKQITTKKEKRDIRVP